MVEESFPWCLLPHIVFIFILCYQPRNDMLPCLDVIKEYLGLIFTFPDMVQIHRGASSKVHDCDKMKEEGRIDVSQWYPFLLKLHNYTWTIIHLLQVVLYTVQPRLSGPLCPRADH